MRQEVRAALIEELEGDLDVHESEIVRIRDLLAYLKGRPVEADKKRPAAPRRARPDTGTARDFATRVLSGGGTYGPADVVKEAKLLGWETTSEYPNSIMRHILRSLADDGVAEKLDGGKYRQRRLTLMQEDAPELTPEEQEIAYGSEAYFGQVEGAR